MTTPDDAKLVKYVVSEKPRDPAAVQVVYCCRRCKGNGETWDGSDRPPQQCPDCGGTGLAGFASASPAALPTALRAASELYAEGLRTALEDAKNNGLIYWEPNTTRGHESKMAMLARIDAALSLPAPEPGSVGRLADIWQQARENHAKYSATGSVEEDIRFFALGLTGEAGEVANFVKKRWRDGDAHAEDLRKECADVLAYTIMLAEALGMSENDLIAMVAYKQKVFVEKMKARAVMGEPEGGE